ncbi:hypothetical protein SARC_16456, partial [Sphaeroforma arctica JP610]
TFLTKPTVARTTRWAGRRRRIRATTAAAAPTTSPSLGSNTSQRTCCSMSVGDLSLRQPPPLLVSI